MKTNETPDVRLPLRLVVRVLQDVIRSESFTTYGDVAEALKARCARLRIPYDCGLVSAAIDQIERGGAAPIVKLPIRRRLVEREPEPDPIAKADAAAILDAVYAAVGKGRS